MQINGIGQSQLSSQVADVAKDAAAAKDAKSDAKLKSTCKDMEAVFLNMLLSKMRETVHKSSLLGDRSQEDIMTSLLDNEMTKNMSQAGGIGLADMMYRQLTLDAKAKKSVD